jgi:hypothetical protein
MTAALRFGDSADGALTRDGPASMLLGGVHRRRTGSSGHCESESGLAALAWRRWGRVAAAGGAGVGFV